MTRWQEVLHPRDRDGKFRNLDVSVSYRGDSGSIMHERNGWPEQSGGVTSLPHTDMVDLDEIRETLKYGTDFFAYHRPSGWRELLERALKDPKTPAHMASVAEDGMEPVMMTDEMVPIGGGHEELQRMIHNGNHRLAIALLMGVEKLPISSHDYQSDDHEKWNGREGHRVSVNLGGPPVTELPAGAAAVIAQAQEILRKRRERAAARR